MIKPNLQFPTIFSTSTPLTKERFKSLENILSSLFKHPDSDEFRKPLAYKERGLINYDVVIQTPMDISTVQKRLKTNSFQTCEEYLDFTQTIFENSILYNKKTQWILTLTKKCELVFHKLVKNHLPEVKFKNDLEGKKLLKKNKRLQKDLQNLEAEVTETGSFAQSLSQKEESSKGTSEQNLSIQKESQNNLTEPKSSKDTKYTTALFDLIHQASDKSLEVLYIMTKNEDMGAISTERNGTFKIKVGNCAIDVKKLSKNFIKKAILFLRDDIERVKNLENKENKKKFKIKHVADLGRYEI